jgi:hypothetical protein
MKKIIKNGWPVAIAGYFFVFICAMTAWIVYASQQQVDLVSKDYYADEIRFQTQINRINNTSKLSGKASVNYNAKEQTVKLQLPAGEWAEKPEGHIQFYRPSNAAWDVEKKLEVNEEGKQLVSVSKLEPGFWKVRVYWKIGGNEFYHDQPLMITGGP